MLPAIAKHHDGCYFIIARIADSQSVPTSSAGEQTPQPMVLIQDMRDQGPRTVSIEDLQSRWSGEIIALTRRQGFGQSLQEKFDISWFIPSLVKYRKMFIEVLIVSFFLQIFALITPLFFQVVMDKVLVHRGFTTLDVLAVGFFIVITFSIHFNYI